MSTSPLPPDPYEALGVSRDCDVDAVKKAHRKLVLKHHPDRIKDPALVEHNQNEFTKVQQAYELLADPVRRRRYDDECKLAQLRRERMSESRPTYTRTTYTARPAPAPANPVQREFKAEPRYAYEERVPDSPYVESTSRGFDDQIPRGTSRKVDPKVEPSERRSSTAKPAERKDKPRASGWERDKEKEKQPMSMKTVFGMAAMASGMAQKAKAKEKEREKEIHAKNAKARDKEERSARDMKNTYTRPPAAYVEDYSEGDSSGSESETIVAQGRSRMRRPSPNPRARHSLTPEPPRTKRQPSPMSEVRTSRQLSPRPMQKPTRRLSPAAAPKPTRQPSPRPEARSTRQPSPRPEARPLRQPSPRPDQRSAYDDDSQDDEKYERHYRNAQDYLFTAQRKDPRPPLSRQGSSVQDQYWHTDSGRDRKSGSDSDKQRPSSSQKPSRRSMPPDESKLRPSLFQQSSAPAGVRSMAGAESRDPFATPRSRGNSYVSSNPRREAPPELKRSPSEPVPQKLSAKRDSVPLKGSSLKQAESMQNQDSGYGSSSNPQTPETRGESPHRESRESRESRPRETSSTTKYQVRKDDDGPRARKMGADDGAPMSRFLSPEDQPHHHHHHNPASRERHASRSREREAEGRHRSSSNRPAYPESKPSFHRNESNSRFDDRDRSRNIRAERSPDRHGRGGGGGGGGQEGYFREWPGAVKESRNKPATYQAAPMPSFSKYYGEPSPRSTQQHRRPSVYAG